MLVRQIAVGTMQNFVYLLADKPGGEGLVVDSGWETEPIVDAAKEAASGSSSPSPRTTTSTHVVAEGAGRLSGGEGRGSPALPHRP